MAAKPKKAEAPKQKPLPVVKTSEAESDGRAVARAFLRPSVNHALTMQSALMRGFGGTELMDVVDELSDQCGAVIRGNLGRPEALLTAQAHTLDALFNDLTRLAYRNMDNFSAAERLFRLAFKAQGQSRATLETVGALKNPGMVIARQANIAHGPQRPE